MRLFVSEKNGIFADFIDEIGILVCILDGDAVVFGRGYTGII